MREKSLANTCEFLLMQKLKLKKLVYSKFMKKKGRLKKFGDFCNGSIGSNFLKIFLRLFFIFAIFIFIHIF